MDIINEASQRYEEEKNSLYENYHTSYLDLCESQRKVRELLIWDVQKYDECVTQQSLERRLLCLRFHVMLARGEELWQKFSNHIWSQMGPPLTSANTSDNTSKRNAYPPETPANTLKNNGLRKTEDTPIEASASMPKNPENTPTVAPDPCQTNE
jgi:hypothetical protein